MPTSIRITPGNFVLGTGHYPQLQVCIQKYEGNHVLLLCGDQLYSMDLGAHGKPPLGHYTMSMSNGYVKFSPSAGTRRIVFCPSNNSFCYKDGERRQIANQLEVAVSHYWNEFAYFEFDGKFCAIKIGPPPGAGKFWLTEQGFKPIPRDAQAFLFLQNGQYVVRREQAYICSLGTEVNIDVIAIRNACYEIGISALGHETTLRWGGDGNRYEAGKCYRLSAESNQALSVQYEKAEFWSPGDPVTTCKPVTMEILPSLKDVVAIDFKQWAFAKAYGYQGKSRVYRVKQHEEHFAGNLVGGKLIT